jgi:serine protease Do
MGALDDIQSAIESVASAAGPSIVGVGRRHRGSGVVISRGRILTNAHNLRGDEVTISFADGRAVTGRVLGVDVDGDLAVVDVETGSAQPLPWASGEPLAPGAVVFGAAASPSGGTRITFGTVSAVSRAFRGPGGRRIDGSVEHTAPLAPGSSGGALLDARGQLLGINTSRLGEGFYLARPADALLRERVEALSKGESPARARLGVAVAPAHVARRLRRSVGLPDREGLLVRAVEEGSPAEVAGIAQGDLVIEVAGRPVVDADGLVEAIAAGAAGGIYEVKLVRGTEDRSVTVGAPAPRAGQGRGRKGRTPGDA